MPLSFIFLLRFFEVSLTHDFCYSRFMFSSSFLFVMGESTVLPVSVTWYPSYLLYVGIPMSCLHSIFLCYSTFRLHLSLNFFIWYPSCTQHSCRPTSIHFLCCGVSFYFSKYPCFCTLEQSTFNSGFI